MDWLLRPIISAYQSVVNSLTGPNAVSNSNAVIAVAMVLNFGASILLWWANRRTATTTRMIFLNQFKPIIGVQQEIEWGPGKGQHLEKMIMLGTTLKNSGQTAASIFDVAFHLLLTIKGSPPMKDEWLHFGPTEARFTLPPGETKKFDVPVFFIGPVEDTIAGHNPLKYRIEISYHGMANDYYCHIEEREYDYVRERFVVRANYTVEYSRFQRAYGGGRKRIGKLFRRVRSYYRRKRAEKENEMKATPIASEK
ncbi:MAG: hypothetical protein Q8922_00925 [Bacteroidota bacterium]|nr:hypothetical protein [Bacteroidota bacterium]